MMRAKQGIAGRGDPVQVVDQQHCRLARAARPHQLAREADELPLAGLGVEARQGATNRAVCSETATRSAAATCSMRWASPTTWPWAV
jgi:hypothetical protein